MKIFLAGLACLCAAGAGATEPAQNRAALASNYYAYPYTTAPLRRRLLPPQATSRSI